jgi:hypothetical protein
VERVPAPTSSETAVPRMLVDTLGRLKPFTAMGPPLLGLMVY